MTESAEDPKQKSQATAQGNFQAFAAKFPSTLALKEERAVARFRSHRGNAVTKLKDLVSLADNLMRTVAPFTACATGGRGCDACCYYPVSLCEPEIALIEAFTARRRAKGAGSVSSTRGTPCPFLERGSCTIYPVRPFRCRTHHSFDSDNYWCDIERSEEIELPVVRFSELEKAFDENRIGMPVFDIRDVFPR